VDESFPQDLSLEELEGLPSLKALIYKPTIQGGMLGCRHLHAWAKRRGVDLVLSSSFESDLGLAHIASIAHRLSLLAPVGIGTYHHLGSLIAAQPLHFSHSSAHIPATLIPKTEFLRSRL
jgi:o-succinylbenzoate synthase